MKKIFFLVFCFGTIGVISSQSFAVCPRGTVSIANRCVRLTPPPPPPRPVCGNGRLETGEECDDGNRADTDACTNACRRAKCGDRIVQTGVEQCDDGNAVNTDTCRNNCQLPRCGDEIQDSGEECDDGNNVSLDGCDFSCTIESPNCLSRNEGRGDSECPTWTRIFPESADPNTTNHILMGNDIAVDPQGNVNVIGTTYNYREGGYNAFVGHYDHCGNLSWSRIIDDGGGNDYGYGIDNDNDGKVYIIGALSQVQIYGRTIIRAYSPDGGSELWTRYVEGSCPPGGFGSIEGRAITADNFGNLYATGLCKNSSGKRYWINKYSQIDGTTAGTPWPQLGALIYDGHDYLGNGIVANRLGSIFVLVNNDFLTRAGPSNVQILKFMPGGSPDLSFGTSGLATFSPSESRAFSGGGVAVDSCGEAEFVYTSGFARMNDSVSPINQFLLVKFGATGELIDEPFPLAYSSLDTPASGPNPLDPSEDDVAVDSSGNVYVTGAYRYTGMGCAHIGVSKYSSTGELLWSDIVDSSEFPRNQCGAGRGIAVGQDGSVFVTGQFHNSSIDNGHFIWLRKYTPCGVSDDGPPDVQNDPACGP